MRRRAIRSGTSIGLPRQPPQCTCHGWQSQHPVRFVQMPLLLEPEMSTQPSKQSGYLFIAAGIAFFAAAALGKQPAFAGVGAAFVAIGAGMVHKARKAP
jgi:hypothetical protein